MKNILVFIIGIAAMAMVKPSRHKVVFFGDSITQMGINKGGYIDRIQTLVIQQGLQNKYQLIGAGVGANKVYDLYLRLEDDVLNKKANIVVVWIGINDVWHKTSGIGTDIEKYERFYRALIKKMQAKKIKLILVTPAAIGEKYDGSNPQDMDLDLYCDVIRKLAKEYNCKLADLRDIFMKYEKIHNTANAESGILTTDRVHLNDKGNQLAADEIWKQLGTF